MEFTVCGSIVWLLPLIYTQTQAAAVGDRDVRYLPPDCAPGFYFETQVQECRNCKTVCGVRIPPRPQCDPYCVTTGNPFETETTTETVTEGVEGGLTTGSIIGTVAAITVVVIIAVIITVMCWKFICKRWKQSKPNAGNPTAVQMSLLNNNQPPIPVTRERTPTSYS